MRMKESMGMDHLPSRDVNSRWGHGGVLVSIHFSQRICICKVDSMGRPWRGGIYLSGCASLFAAHPLLHSTLDMYSQTSSICRIIRLFCTCDPHHLTCVSPSTCPGYFRRKLIMTFATSLVQVLPQHHPAIFLSAQCIIPSVYCTEQPLTIWKYTCSITWTLNLSPSPFQLNSIHILHIPTLVFPSYSFCSPLSLSSILIILLHRTIMPGSLEERYIRLEGEPDRLRIYFMFFTIYLQWWVERIFKSPLGAYPLASTYPSLSTPRDAGNRPLVSYHLMSLLCGGILW
jgi:hypothetical protein